MKLDIKYPQLARGFGSAVNFINLLATTYPDTYLTHITTLLNRKTQMVILSPLEYRFTLYETYGAVDQQAVIYQEPYSVYTINRDHLYSVSNHQGIYGNSILDALPMIDYPASSLFYLQYSTFQGKQEIFLCNGNVPPPPPRQIKTQLPPTGTQAVQNLFNQLTFSFTISPSLPILTAYFLPTPVPTILTPSQIINSSLSQVTTSSISPLQLFPSQSGWLTFVPSLTLSNIQGTGSDRLISSNGAYYLTIDQSSLVRQSFSLPSLSTYQGINITATLL